MNDSFNSLEQIDFDSPSGRALTSFCESLARSYQQLTGRTLIPGLNLETGASDSRIVTEQLLQHNAVILAHNTAPDPTFVFANRTAMQLWEYRWDEIIGLPSRLTAEPDLRPDREQLLARVREHGFIDDYSGIRVSKSGKRFLIERATVWNVFDSLGQRLGQAATFAEWTPTESGDP